MEHTTTNMHEYEVLPFDVSKPQTLYAMRIKLNDEIIAILETPGDHQVSVRLCDDGSDTVLVVDGSEYSVDSYVDKPDLHDLYHVCGSKYARIGAIHRKLVVKRVTDGAMVHNGDAMHTNNEAKHKVMSVATLEETNNTQSNQKKRTLKRKKQTETRVNGKKSRRKSPAVAALSVDVHAKRSSPLAPMSTPPVTPSTQILKERIKEQLRMHPLGMTAYALSQAILKKPPYLLFLECLDSVGVHDPNTSLYTLRRDTSTAPAAPSPVHSRVEPSQPLPPPDETSVESDEWGIEFTDVVVATAPEEFEVADSSEQYETLCSLHNSKYETYTKLDKLLSANSRLFTSLSEQLEACDPSDHRNRRRLKRLVKAYYDKRSALVEKMVKLYRLLHLELSQLQQRIKDYANRVSVQN